MGHTKSREKKCQLSQSHRARLLLWSSFLPLLQIIHVPSSFIFFFSSLSFYVFTWHWHWVSMKWKSFHFDLNPLSREWMKGDMESSLVLFLYPFPIPLNYRFMVRVSLYLRSAQQSRAQVSGCMHNVYVYGSKLLRIFQRYKFHYLLCFQVFFFYPFCSSISAQVSVWLIFFIPLQISS